LSEAVGPLLQRGLRGDYLMTRHKRNMESEGHTEKELVHRPDSPAL